MERIINYEIDVCDQNQTITSFLLRKGYSRHNLTKLKKIERSILVNDEWVYLNHLLVQGEHLKIRILETNRSEHIEADNIPLSIRYEDEDILVINKPAGMPVHPSMNHYHHTLANAVAYYYQAQNKEIVFRCINRLDRNTSGLILLAKHMLSGAVLGDAMKKRQIKRTYMAIVAGEDLPDEGTIDLPIGRKDDSLIERVIDREHGKEAVTHYQVVERKNGLSLLNIHLDTGRTHQIRVHMKAIGHPLIGDEIYAPKWMLMNRQALHSESLTFRHPVTGTEMTFQEPYPIDMEQLFR
ncbi:MAG: RluA family pseudouridine synthase [Clostridia bacterium]|nr:RluA family pseudouridine synthase [Clostridia bacterium]